jgi:hypothetical protein
MSKSRRTISQEVAENVLLKSKRRCCLCFVDGNDELRAGAIAHIQPFAKGGTDAEDNFVFLCADHHVEFDRGEIDIDKLRMAKARLYQAMGQSTEVIDAGVSKPWQKFEEHVRNVLTRELKNAVKDDISIYSNRVYSGRSGVSHQIDISAELNLAGFKLLIAVDVKYAKRKIGIQDLEQFAGAIQDIAANKGIFVSNTGYSESALRYAKSRGITLVQLSEKSEEIKKGVLAESVL